MKTSTLYKRVVLLRKDLEENGYILHGIGKHPLKRSYYYYHIRNNNEIVINLDCEKNELIVHKNQKRII